MLTLTGEDNGRHLAAHVNDVIELLLPENATTGYRWSLDGDDSPFLQLLDSTGNYPEAAVGSGGVAIFRFQVLRAGSGTLALKYWRHWEGEGSVVQRFSVTIDAGP